MPVKDLAHIGIISPASRDLSSTADARIKELETNKLPVSYHKLSPDPSWPFTAGTRQDRLDQLSEALLNPSIKFLLGLRGGYGTSDLLDDIPWEKLKLLRPKTIVGFSDISALHSAFYTKLRWSGLHAPMPATAYWGQNGREDVVALLNLLSEQKTLVELPLTYLGRGFISKLVGPAFGGCLSVLSNLIGTPYFPKQLSGHILYWEDIGEHPARILRFINQWQQSGALEGALGLILGQFVGCEVDGFCSESQLRSMIAERLSIPVWYCPKFGHCSPNWPLPIGLPMTISENQLQWNSDMSFHAKFV